MADINAFVALRLVMPGWPTSIISIPPSIDHIGLAAFESTAVGSDTFTVNGTLQIIDEITMDIVLIPGMSLALLYNGVLTEFDFDLEYLPEYFYVSLHGLNVGIRFQSNLLKRMERIGDDFVEALPDPITGLPLPVEILLSNVELSVDSNGEFTTGFTEGAFTLAIPPFMIGDSGIIIEITSLSLILSATAAATMPESIPADWRGVYLEEATIHLPEGLQEIIPEEIRFENAFIGSGGFSGSVFFETGATGYNDATAKTLLGFGFTLKVIDIAFQQNTLTRSGIQGYLKIPFFDEAVLVDVSLTNDGDFTIAVATADGLFTLQKDGIISIDVTALEFIKEANDYAVKISGELTPLLAGFEWPSFELNGLTIHSDGTVQVEGGWIELPDQKALDFHGFKIEIAKLGFGNEEEGGVLYKWVGFSGGIQIINELPIKGGVEGLKVMWDIHGNVKLKIGGVYLSFSVENVIDFNGSVYFVDEEGVKEFRGGVALNIIPVNLGIDAQFITGRDEVRKFNYFYIFIGIDLPVGIPLGPPVLGLYGLAGLYGQNMGVDYQKLIDYTDVEHRPDLSDAGIWDKEKNAMAFGAGITVGTLPDTKFTVKVKALFVILIPGPVLLIEGHAGILSVEENYLLRVLAVFDMAAGSFLMNISAGYDYPKGSGDLLDISGSAEAYFSAADPDSWHLYLGQNDPESKRIRADIFSFFKAQTWLMVDQKGLQMGAWIGYSLNEKYGVLRVVLEAWISGELGLSLQPLQGKGAISLYGNAELSVSIVSLGISVEANVSAQAPKPLSIAASMQVQLKTPLGKPKATIKLKWEKSGEPAYPIPLSTKQGIEHRKVTKNWEVAKSSGYPVDNDGLLNQSEAIVTEIPSVIPLVPPDVYLVINFDKPMRDSGLSGSNPAPSPDYKTVGDYQFKYELLHVSLQYSTQFPESNDDNAWTDYSEIGEPLSGCWQVLPNTENIENTRLILNASTPFEIARNLENTSSWWSMIDLYNPEYPCNPIAPEETICADVESKDIGTYYNVLVDNDFIFTSPYPLQVQGYNAVWLQTIHAVANEDNYTTIECLQIKLKQPGDKKNIVIVDKVIFTAGFGYDSFLQLTNEFSNGDIELFINQSFAGVNFVPASIQFTEQNFGSMPYQVWVTCVVPDGGDGAFLTALDENDNVLDTARMKPGTGTNEAVTYGLMSDDAPIRRITITGLSIRIVEVCYMLYHRVDANAILVTAPQPLYSATIHLSKGSDGNIFVYDNENAQLQNISFDIAEDISDADIQPIVVQLSENTFRSFLITGHYKLIRICGVTPEAHDTYQHNAGLSSHLQTSLDETWGRHVAQILQPNTFYRLKINTATSRRKNNGDWSEETFEEYMYFKTGNPPGTPSPVQLAAPADMRYDLSEPLKDLSGYISYTIPANAAADEPQKAVYRSYDIGVVYNDSYIDQMYQMAEQPITIQLSDNNNKVVQAGLINRWGDNPVLSQTREEKHYQDILDDSSCVAISTSVDVENNNEIIAFSRDLLLLPLAQYTASVMAGAAAVYVFNFITSRYASFLHHIHSFIGVVWDHFSLLQNPEYSVDTVVLEHILENSESNAVKFEQLINLFDLGPRQLPAVVEVALLGDKDQSYCLLIESPEPFDWQRTTLSFQYNNAPVQVTESRGAVKITGGSVESVGQWIDILVVETVDLGHYMITYGGEEKEYFRFAGDSLYNAGTSLRIYNKAIPSVLVETEYIQLYKEFTDVSFPFSSIVTQLKNSSGEIVDSAIVYLQSAFEALPVTSITNADGTSLFVFVRQNGQIHYPLATGIYRVNWSYQRDIGSADAVLTRFGFDDPEDAGITFSISEA